MGRLFGHPVSLETRKKLRIATLGKKHSPETIAKMREKRKDNTWNKGRKGLSKANCGSFRPGQFAREKHPMWRGGISSTREYQNHYIRLNKAKRRGAKGMFSQDEWEELKKKCTNMCLCCKRFEPEIKLTIDHIVPIKLGGSNFITNIQPLCMSCNSRKSAKNIDYISSYFLIRNIG